ncbi:hypothetical protein C8Q76DRAFT_61086 [Earliella scabrosa]|nr:hypothetical protein C8Q76DRAFT_61086 [Earliella scabrosa]
MKSSARPSRRLHPAHDHTSAAHTVSYGATPEQRTHAAGEVVGKYAQRGVRLDGRAGGRWGSGSWQVLRRRAGSIDIDDARAYTSCVVKPERPAIHSIVSIASRRAGQRRCQRAGTSRWDRVIEPFHLPHLHPSAPPPVPRVLASRVPCPLSCIPRPAPEPLPSSSRIATQSGVFAVRVIVITIRPSIRAFCQLRMRVVDFQLYLTVYPAWWPVSVRLSVSSRPPIPCADARSRSATPVLVLFLFLIAEYSALSPECLVLGTSRYMPGARPATGVLESGTAVATHDRPEMLAIVRGQLCTPNNLSLMTLSRYLLSWSSRACCTRCSPCAPDLRTGVKSVSASLPPGFLPISGAPERASVRLRACGLSGSPSRVFTVCSNCVPDHSRR